MSILAQVRAKLPRPARYQLYLVPFVLLYFAVSLWLSLNRMANFQTSNWDLGIFQQALWSTSHGRLLWEAGDFQTYGVSSFLQVHPSFLALVLVPVYQLAPTPLSLFVVQSMLVSVAAFPLASLTRHLTGSERAGFIVGGLYLVQASVLGANLYDFHMEAFFPLEVFLLLLVWNRGRPFLVVLLSMVTIITLEVGPVLVASISLFLLAPEVSRLARELWAPAPGSSSSPRRAALRRFFSWQGAHGVPFGLLMLVGAVLGYLVLRTFQYQVIPQVVGAVPQASAATAADASTLGISLSNLRVGLLAKASYWVLAFGLVGFLPLRSPWSLVLIAPWALYTFLVSSLAFTSLGFQYGFVATPLIMVGAAYGARGLSFPSARDLIRWAVPGRHARATPPEANATRSGARLSRWVLVIVAAVAFNLVVSPVDPLMQKGLSSAGYQVDYVTGPGFPETTALVGLIPSNASVLASSRLFPLVANDLSAYSLPSTGSAWTPFSVFNLTNPPPYVLLAQKEVTLVPAWLTRLIYSTLYGIRGVVWSTSAGTVLLFEKGWKGVTASWLSPPAIPMNLSGPGLVIGPAGHVVERGGIPGSQAIQSRPGLGGAIWYGPYTSLAAGNYTVTLEVTAQLWDAGLALGTTGGVLQFQVGAFGAGNWVDRAYTLAQLGNGTVRQINLPINVTADVTDFEVRGYQINTNVIITMDYVVIAAA